MQTMAINMDTEFFAEVSCAVLQLLMPQMVAHNLILLQVDKVFLMFGFKKYTISYSGASTDLDTHIILQHLPFLSRFDMLHRRTQLGWTLDLAYKQHKFLVVAPQAPNINEHYILSSYIN